MSTSILHTIHSAIFNSFSFLKREYKYRRLLIVGISLLLHSTVLSQSEYKVFKYADGSVSSEGTMVDGRPNGYWKTYYENGNLQSEGNRKDFLLDNLWVFYREDGSKKQTVTYRADKKDGLTTNFRDGVKYEEVIYEANLRQGESKIFYPTGELHKLVPFVDDKEKGEGYEYDRNGMVITLLFFDEGYLRRSEKINRYDKEGKKRGPWKEFHANRQVSMEGYYMNNLKNGIFKYFDSDGNLLTLEKYKDGELVVDSEQSIILDIRNTYYPDGSIKSSGGYVDGKKQGTHRIYNQEGEVIRGEVYSAGVKTGEGIIDPSGDFEGEWKLYYDTGELKAEGSYEKSNRTGDWVFYHKNGKIEHRGKYAEGKPQGDWTWYFEDGKLRRQEYYRRGKEDGESEEFDEDGNVISKGEYVGGLKDGKWFYHVGDHTEEGEYLDGEKQGEWVFTYDNGQLNYKGEYIAGLATGKHKWYYPTGQVKKEGKYSSGVRIGTWNTYSEEGIKVLEVKYKNGLEHKINGKKVVRSEPDDEEIQ